MNIAGNIRLTWGEIKNFVGLPLGYCATNPNLLPLVNESIKILWDSLEPIHKMARYKFKLGTNCCGNRFITWPNEVETVEMINICDSPIPVRNIYAEFVSNGIGNMEYLNNNLLSGNGPGPGAPYTYNGWATMIGDREEVPTYEDVQGPDKKIKVVSSLPADDGSQVIILGYDQNEQWIRTLVNGTYTDGEYVTLNAASPPTTTNFFSAIKGVQFSVTPRNGIVYLVEHDTVTTLERTIAEYQYNEANPVYRRSIITGSAFATCVCVMGIVRLRWVPIFSDTDYLQISNLSALKDMLLALQKRDNGMPDDAMKYQMLAEKKVNAELSQYQGVAPKKVVSFQRRNLWGLGANVR